MKTLGNTKRRTSTYEAVPLDDVVADTNLTQCDSSLTHEETLECEITDIEG